MSTKSFIEADHYRPVLHNVCALGRTNVLHHLLVSPNAESLERLLKGVFAKTFANRSFSSPEEAKDFFLQELQHIHPCILDKYRTEIDQQDSVENVQQLARKLFRSFSKSDARGLSTKIKADISIRVLDKGVVTAAVGNLWRSVCQGKQPRETALQDYVCQAFSQMFPGIEHNSTLGALKVQEYVLNCKKEIRTLSSDEEIKSFALRKHDTMAEDFAFLQSSRNKQVELTFASIWNRVLDMTKEQHGNGPTVEEAIHFAAEKLKLFPVAIRNLYLRDLALSQDISSLHRRVEGYLNDPISAQYTPGMKSTKASSEGSQGFPKVIDLQRQHKLTGFMKYVSGSREMQVHRLYKFFLEECAGIQTCASNFLVPQGAMLEFSGNKARYTDASGQSSGPRNSAEGQYVRDLIEWMSLANTERDFGTIEKEIGFHQFLQTHPIALFDLVNGSNLAEFFLANYLSLDSEKKQAVFQGLGMIVFLDFLLGNQDRLVRLGREEGDSFEEIFSHQVGFSNIANIMVSENGNTLYTIDNAIGDGYLADVKTVAQEREERDSYQAFLSQTLILDDFEQKLSSRFLGSLMQTFHEMKEACDIEDIRELQRQGREIPQILLINELKENHSLIERAVQEGIVRMRTYIKDVMIPVWNSPHADPIKNTLDEDLVDTIQERFDLYRAIELGKLSETLKIGN